VASPGEEEMACFVDIRFNEVREEEAGSVAEGVEEKRRRRGTKRGRRKGNAVPRIGFGREGATWRLDNSGGTGNLPEGREELRGETWGQKDNKTTPRFTPRNSSRPPPHSRPAAC